MAFCFVDLLEGRQGVNFTVTSPDPSTFTSEAHDRASNCPSPTQGVEGGVLADHAPSSIPASESSKIERSASCTFLADNFPSTVIPPTISVNEIEAAPVNKGMHFTICFCIDLYCLYHLFLISCPYFFRGSGGWGC